MSDPWFKFYASDWLAGTRGLTAAETGIYVTLIAMMYERGESIPRDDVRLSRLCGCPKASFTRALNALIDEGKVTVGDGGVLSCDISDVWAEKSRKNDKRPWVPLAVQRFVYDRDGRVCKYCGCTDGPFHLDHILPWSRGGQHTAENLTVACASCNWSKGSMTVSEWRGY